MIAQIQPRENSRPSCATTIIVISSIRFMEDNTLYLSAMPTVKSTLVTKVLSEVSNEVKQWQQSVAQEAFASLAPPSLSVETDPSDAWKDYQDDLLFFTGLDSDDGVEAILEEVLGPDDSLGLTVTEFIDGEVGTARLPLKEYTVDIFFPPVPNYESCAPIERSINREDDPAELAFLPLVDDPTFKPNTFLDLHKSFRWVKTPPDSIGDSMQSVYI